MTRRLAQFSSLPSELDALVQSGMLTLRRALVAQESTAPAGRAADNFHGVYAESVIRELTSAGFEDATSEEIARRAFIVGARRPPARPADVVYSTSSFPEPSGRSVSRQPH